MRCNGRTTIRVPTGNGVSKATISCPVCLGLGVKPPPRRKPPDHHHFVAVHDPNANVWKLINQLPEVNADDDE